MLASFLINFREAFEADFIIKIIGAANIVRKDLFAKHGCEGQR